MQRKGYTAEQLMAGVKNHATIEMHLFDSLHPVVRNVMTEHVAPVFLRQLFQENPGAYQLAQENPYLFAQKLRALMDRGCWGRLESCHPPITVPAWTSMTPRACCAAWPKRWRPGAAQKSPRRPDRGFGFAHDGPARPL